MSMQYFVIYKQLPPKAISTQGRNELVKEFVPNLVPIAVMGLCGNEVENRMELAKQITAKPVLEAVALDKLGPYSRLPWSIYSLTKERLEPVL